MHILAGSLIEDPTRLSTYYYIIIYLHKTRPEANGLDISIQSMQVDGVDVDIVHARTTSNGFFSACFVVGSLHPRPPLTVCPRLCCSMARATIVVRVSTFPSPVLEASRYSKMGNSMHLIEY